MNSTSRYFRHNDQAARYVEGLMEVSKPDLPLTIVIVPEKSGGCSVLIVTIELLEGIDEKTSDFYKPWLPTSTENTPVG